MNDLKSYISDNVMIGIRKQCDLMSEEFPEQLRMVLSKCRTSYFR